VLVLFSILLYRSIRLVGLLAMTRLTMLGSSLDVEGMFVVCVGGSCSMLSSWVSLTIDTSTGHLLSASCSLLVTNCRYCCCLTRLVKKLDTLVGLKMNRDRSLRLLLNRLLSRRNLCRLASLFWRFSSSCSLSVDVGSSLLAG